jgi:hypothetical protein
MKVCGAAQLNATSDSKCECFNGAHRNLFEHREIGMDENFGEISVWVCARCAQPWLRYFYENEAFTASGRWYLGAISSDQLTLLTRENAKRILEELDWYFYGGSYFHGHVGKTSGEIVLSL